MITLFLLYEYSKVRVFYKQIYRALDSEDIIEDIVNIGEARTREQKLFTKLLKKLHRSYEGKIYKYEDIQKHYSSFINQWVHQMKTPVSVINLILEEENLCEVCLFKRNYISSIRYNSVYEIAIINWKNIHEDELKKVTRDLAEIFKNYYKYYNKNEITHLIILLKKTKENLKKDFKENIKMYIDFSLNNIIQLLKDNKKNIVLKKLIRKCF